MQDEDKSLTSPVSAQPKPVTVCHPELVKGMAADEAQKFDASYQRARKVLQRINDYARKQYMTLLKDEESIQALGMPNYTEFISDRMASRRVWKHIQELTRTK